LRIYDTGGMLFSMSIATLKDVALLAGVSHTTVSLALRDSPLITDDTKAKVRAAAKKLNYHPNHQARSLVNRKTNVIAIVADSFTSSSGMEMLKGIEQGIRTTESDYTINMFSSMNRDDQVLSDICLGRQADGVILISIDPSPDIIKLYSESGCPMIAIDGNASGSIEISIDNHQGAYMATSHLIAAGRKNLALVSGSRNPMDEMKTGFIRALEDHGLLFDEGMVFHVDDNSHEEGQMIFKQMMNCGHGIDGIFCSAGDIVALGILAESDAEHRRIPEDISIVGYGDDYFSSMVVPSLTTIRPPLFQVGKNGYTRMVRILNGVEKYIPYRYVYEPKLISRASV